MKNPENDYHPLVVEKMFGGDISKNTHGRLSRLSALYRIFEKMKPGETRTDNESVWESFATQQKIKTDQVVLDLKKFANCGLLQERALYDRYGKRFREYAIKLTDQRLKICPKCGAKFSLSEKLEGSL